MALSAYGFFCEDIRQEQHGIFSIVGILPDNINLRFGFGPTGPESELGVPVSADQKFLLKLSAFIRVQFGPDEIPNDGSIRIVLPNGTRHEIGHIEQATFNEAANNARNKENPLAGIITRVEMGGFNPGGPGILWLEVEVDGQVFQVSFIHFSALPTQETATASTS